MNKDVPLVIKIATFFGEKPQKAVFLLFSMILLIYGGIALLLAYTPELSSFDLFVNMVLIYGFLCNAHIFKKISDKELIAICAILSPLFLVWGIQAYFAEGFVFWTWPASLRDWLLFLSSVGAFFVLMKFAMALYKAGTYKTWN